MIMADEIDNLTDKKYGVYINDVSNLKKKKRKSTNKTEEICRETT